MFQARALAAQPSPAESHTKPQAILSGVSAWAWGMSFYKTGFFIAGSFLLVGCFLGAIPAIIIARAYPAVPSLETVARAQRRRTRGPI